MPRFTLRALPPAQSTTFDAYPSICRFLDTPHLYHHSKHFRHNSSFASHRHTRDVDRRITRIPPYLHRRAQHPFSVSLLRRTLTISLPCGGYPIIPPRHHARLPLLSAPSPTPVPSPSTGDLTGRYILSPLLPHHTTSPTLLLIFSFFASCLSHHASHATRTAFVPTYIKIPRSGICFRFSNHPIL